MVGAEIGSRIISNIQPVLLRLATAATLLCVLATGALGQTPTPQQLYQMLLNQQKQIKALQRRATNAERELRDARRLLRKYQGTTAATQKTAIDAQKAAAAARAAAQAANAKIVKIRRDGTRVAGSGVTVTITYAKQDGAYAFAGIVYLKPTHELLGLGVISPDGSTPPSSNGSTIESISTNFTPGARVGFGYGFKGTGVDVRATFTYLLARSSTRLAAPSGGSIAPLLTNPAATNMDDALVATGRYRLLYFVADAEIAQGFRIGRHLGVRVFAGLRVAVLNQTTQALYQGRNFTPGGEFIEERNNFQGLGPRFGVDMRWRFFERFYLLTSFDGSLLIGQNQFSQRQDVVDLGLALSRIQQTDKFVILPNFGARLAIGWKGVISKGVILVVEVGYEFQGWLGAARRISGVDDVSEAFPVRQRADLLLDGPFLMFRLNSTIWACCSGGDKSDFGQSFMLSNMRLTLEKKCFDFSAVSSPPSS